MAVSKLVLGMNARNYLYIQKHNKRRAKERADNKLATKERLIQNDIPTTGLLAVFRSLEDARGFDWSSLPSDFALKPARGYGGEGIMVVRDWDGDSGVLTSGETVTIDEVESSIFDILDGAFSLDNLPDSAFIEERVVPHVALKKISAGGVADVRIIVWSGIPIMGMLRLPTVYSNGRANLHMGALGVGIDMRTGITTQGVLRRKIIDTIPGTKIKVRGIKIPQWSDILSIATRAQDASGLGFAGVDIVLDERYGPQVLEINARPGLEIQVANGASLRTRLERLSGVKVPSVIEGVSLAKQLFAEEKLAEVPVETNILNVVEKITLFGGKGKKTVRAKIDTGAFRTSIDEQLVEELGLDPHHKRVQVLAGSGNQKRHTVRVTFRLRGKEIKTIASYTDRTHMRFPVIVGRKDLKGFLVNPTVTPDDLEKMR